MPARLYIDLTALKKNIDYLSSLSPSAQIMPVLKSNAYGHGSLPIALFLKQYNLSYIAFANTEEALKIKALGYDKPIFILGANEPNDVISGIEANFTVSLNSQESLLALEKLKYSGMSKINVHIKFDTGMNRSGINSAFAADFLKDFLKIKKKLPNLNCEAVYSHLVSANEKDNPLNLAQCKILQDIRKLYREKLGYGLKAHLQNSAGILNFKDFQFDWIRPGLAIYGLSPNLIPEEELRPILSWKSNIININKIKYGDSVSYNQTWRASTNTTIATVLIGYGDGFNTLGSNGVTYGIKEGRKCPTVGRVCMDMSMFDLGFNSRAKIGQELTLMGKNGGLEILAYDIAKKYNTITYEVLTSLTERNQRIYIN